MSYASDVEIKLKTRTRQFGLSIIGFIQKLDSGPVADVIAKQLVRSGTSVGANYRAACRAKSRPDMIAKLAIVEEESDECLYWIDMLIDSNLIPKQDVDALRAEGEEILKMIVASIRTLKSNMVREEAIAYCPEDWADDGRTPNSKLQTPNSKL